MSDDDFKRIGDEFVKVLTPVYENLDQIQKTLDKHSRILKEHTDKIDALTADVIHLQSSTGAIWDKVTSIDEKLDHHIKDERKELNEIREHTNLPPVVSPD